MATGNSTAAENGKSPPPTNQPENEKEKPPAVMSITIRKVKYEYRFLSTVHSLEKLDDFRFQHGCKFGTAKRNLQFESITLHCLKRSKNAGMCPFSLMARRLHPKSIDIHVYAHSEHNHPLKSAAKRAAHRVPRKELMSDSNPPVNFTTADGRQWTFLGTAKNNKEMDNFRLKHHCQRRNKVGLERTRINMHCNTGKCKFHLLARKTDRGRFHMYGHGQHSCNYGTGKNAEQESEEEMNDEEEEEGPMDDEEESVEEEEQMGEDEEESGDMEDEVLEITAEEDAGPSTSSGHIEARQWWTIADIQRRLARALRKGRADRVNKWMARTGQGRTGALLQALDHSDVTKLLQMAKGEGRKGRGKGNMSSSNWSVWVRQALLAHQSALCTQLSENTQRLNFMNGLLGQGMPSSSSSSSVAAVTQTVDSPGPSRREMKKNQE